MRRCAVEVPPVLLGVLAVIALAPGESVNAFLQDRIDAVPQRESARVDDVDEPPLDDGEVLVEGVLVGVCGTDVEISKEGYGQPPAGRDRLTLFHESLGRVVEAPSGSGLRSGDLVAGVVRRPD